MAFIRSYKGVTPEFAEDTFIAETAALIGDVKIGSRSSVWYGTVLRGDGFHIRIGDEVSIQDNSVIHVTSGVNPSTVGNQVSIGHSCVLHGCTIGNLCIIGMGAIIMDRAQVGDRCIVGAGALVTPGTDIPPGHLVLGSPARAKRELTQAEIAWIESSSKHYVEVAASYLAGS